MPELPEVYPLPPLDLTRYSEAARRELYDRLVRIQFTPAGPAPGPGGFRPRPGPGRCRTDRLLPVRSMVRLLAGRGSARPARVAPDGDGSHPTRRHPGRHHALRGLAVGYRRVWPQGAYRALTVRATDDQMIRWADTARNQGKDSPAAFLAWAGDFAVRFLRALEAECRED